MSRDREREGGRERSIYRTIAFQQIRSIHEEQRGARHREIVAVLREIDRQIHSGGVGMVKEQVHGQHGLDRRLDIFGARSRASGERRSIYRFSTASDPTTMFLSLRE